MLMSKQTEETPTTYCLSAYFSPVSLRNFSVPASFEGDFSLVESATVGGHTQPIKMPEGI